MQVPASVGAVAFRRVVVVACAVALSASVAVSVAWTRSGRAQPQKTAQCSLKWRTLKSAVPHGASLWDVDVLSRTDGWAVGQGDVYWKTLAERWNGRRWSRVPTPDVGRKINFLEAVAVLSATDAWAVGSRDIL